MIDTHCHLTNPQLAAQVEQVVDAALQAGVGQMISVATDPYDAREAITLAQRWPKRVFATAGVHPHEAAHFQDRQALTEALGLLLDHPLVVAAGEMGLDNHYNDPPAAAQEQVFCSQLTLLAQRREQGGRDLPIVIHNRMATERTLAMLADFAQPLDRVVFHCFTGTEAELDAILARGAMVSLTGIVTFGNSKALAQASDRIPLERLMVETDAPYLTPEPFRKVRPNAPRYVVEVARFLAQRRGMDMATMQQQLDANAVRFFNLPVVVD